MALDDFQGLIRELGDKIGADGLHADDDGYLCLEFDDLVVHLQHEPDDDMVVAFARLGEVEQIRAEQIYLLLLSANLFWQGANGATLSVEPSTGVVFVADRRPMASLGLETLSAWLERFLDVAGYWQKRLEAVNAGGPLGLVDDPSLGVPPGSRRPGSDGDRFIEV